MLSNISGFFFQEHTYRNCPSWISKQGNQSLLKSVFRQNKTLKYMPRMITLDIVLQFIFMIFLCLHNNWYGLKGFASVKLETVTLLSAAEAHVRFLETYRLLRKPALGVCVIFPSSSVCIWFSLCLSVYMRLFICVCVCLLSVCVYQYVTCHGKRYLR